MSRLGLRLTPHRHLLLEQADNAADLEVGSAARLIDAFARGSGSGLVQLGAGEVGQALPPVLAWWRGIAARYVTSLCLHAPGISEDASPPSALPDVAAPDAAELSTLVLTTPIMPGSEYLTPDLLQALWAEMGTAASTAFAAAKTDLQSFLKGLNPAWNLVGRVHFNLAENHRDPDHPFAFMATYTTQLSAQAKAQHLPLGQALRDYAGKANTSKLLTLLVPIQRAAETCMAGPKIHMGGPVPDVGRAVRRSTPDPFSPSRWCAARRAGHLLSGSRVVIRVVPLSGIWCDGGSREEPLPSCLHLTWSTSRA